MVTLLALPPPALPCDGVAGGGLVDSKVRALGPHVAVRDSPYPVAHPHCLAGFEGRDRERHRREQEPSRLRCVLQMVFKWAGWALHVADDVWYFLLVVVQ